MKTIEIDDATATLAEYARANRRQTLVVTRGGRPIAALMPISAAEDATTFRVGGSRAFQAQIEESRRKNPPGTGLTTEQVRRALAPRRARRTRRPEK